MSGTTGNEVRVGTDLTPEEARTLTDEIRASMEELAPVVTRAYKGRVWIALGYESWEAWVAGELGGPLRLGRNDRKQAVAELRQAGMSLPAIAATTGAGYGTVHRDAQAAYPNGQPQTTTGTDGKEYPATRPDPEPLTPQEQREHERLLAKVASAEWFIDLRVALETLREARHWAAGVRLDGKSPEHIAEVRALVGEARQIVTFIEEKVR